jgi:hypothetical protein
MPCGWYFSDFSGKGSQIGIQALTGRSAVVITLGNGIMKGIGCNQIIVLIVHIVTVCLNADKSFSLFNAAQILCPQNNKKTKHLW